MAILPNEAFPEIFLSTTDDGRVRSGLRSGRLRKIASRLYTSNLTTSPETLIRTHLWKIVGLYFPGALIADRTALEAQPAIDGSVFLVAPTSREITLPGVTLRSRKGVGPLASDRPFVGGLYLSSTPRAFLENMRPSRARTSVARTLPYKAIEEKLEAFLRQEGGEKQLNGIRDQARLLAPQLDLEEELQELDTLIGGLLSTREAPLESAPGKARARGEPFDPVRTELFQLLFAELRRTPPRTRQAVPASAALPFFEAYFSNFIEGTEFEVEEASAIIFEGRIPEERPQDAHDIIGTYQLVSNDSEMRRTPRVFEEFLALLKERHRLIMEWRPEKLPGQFKNRTNRAGSTVFVAPELVVGTLRDGFAFYQALETPLARAVFMTFLVAEVHPFADGNGRVARVMMNAELVTAGEQRIIIPTAYRDNYIAGLKALSQSRQPDKLVRILDFAQRYTALIDWSDMTQAQRVLTGTNAFLNSVDAESSGRALRLPAPNIDA